jgi:signal transduction histidine kinase
METKKSIYFPCTTLNSLIESNCKQCKNFKNESCPFLKIEDTPLIKVYNEHIKTIAHELRSPLAIITSSTINQMNYLKDLFYSANLDDDTNLDYIKKIKEQILLIHDQVNNIDLFISSITEHEQYNQSCEIMAINIKDYLKDIIKISKSISRSMLVFGEDALSFGDVLGNDFDNVYALVNPQELNRIIFNIISNAADAVSNFWHKKIQQNSTYIPKLKIRCLKSKDPFQTLNFKNDVIGPFGHEKNNCEFFIIIEDNGPGIEQSIIKQLFKTTITTKENNHYGFGLKICEELAKKNRLSLYVKSTPNIGTKFIIGFHDIFISNKITEKDIAYNSINNIDYELLYFSKDSEDLYCELVNSENEKEETANKPITDRIKVFTKKNRK